MRLFRCSISVIALTVLASISCFTGCTKKTSSDSPANSGGSGGENPLDAIRRDANRIKSSNNLKEIALGVILTSDINRGVLSPALFSSEGKPLLSWRVAILPAVEHQVLYDEFHLDEPWDSEHNKKLIPKMPKFYLLPGQNNEGLTHYRAFVSIPNVVEPNKSASFDWGDPARPGSPNPLRYPDSLTDGAANTIMVAESEEGVVWTKPDEFIYDPKKPIPKLAFQWNDRAHIAMWDGSVRLINKTISESTLRAAITRSGGEILGADW